MSGQVRVTKGGATERAQRTERGSVRHDSRENRRFLGHSGAGLLGGVTSSTPPAYHVGGGGAEGQGTLAPGAEQRYPKGVSRDLPDAVVS